MPGESDHAVIASALGKLGRAGNRSIDLIETIFGGLFLLLAVVLVGVEVALRGLAGTSLVGAEQIASFLIMWSLFFAASHAIARNRHVRVDILRNLLAPRAQWVLELLISLCMLMFTVFLTVSGYALVLESYQLGDETIGLLPIPFWIPQLVMILGGGFMSIRIVQRLVSLIKSGEIEPDDDLLPENL